LESPSSFSRRVPWAELGEFSHNDHCALFAAGAAGDVGAGEFSHQILGGLLGDFGQSGIKSQQLATLRESVLLGSVGEKAEVTDAHKAVGQNKVTAQPQSPRS